MTKIALSFIVYLAVQNRLSIYADFLTTKTSNDNLINKIGGIFE
jgi:hypothetical protein